MKDLIAARLADRTPQKMIPASPESEYRSADHGEGLLVPAAVLVPLIERPAGMTVLLTQRARHLNAHAGQISFPGGRLEPRDRDAVDAALRETEEEIGLHRAAVSVVGQLDLCVTGTGFEVAPVVGLIAPPIALTPDPEEVADIFEVPLAFVMNPANHRRDSMVIPGRGRREFYVLLWRGRYIWGATARMLVNLHDLLNDGACDPANKADRVMGGSS